MKHEPCNCSQGNYLCSTLKPEHRCECPCHKGLKPRYDRRGQLSFWFILPTENLRKLVMRRAMKLYPQLNYVVGWMDVNGWGLHLTIADWASAKHPYINLR